MNEANIPLSELSEFITCPVCEGYLIDATTINECLHTFCRSCIVKYIKDNHNDCPKCNTLIHEMRPLDYILPDRSKQDIVYKLVPRLYISELNKRVSAGYTQDIDTLTQYILKKRVIEVILVQRCINQPPPPPPPPRPPPSQPPHNSPPSVDGSESADEKATNTAKPSDNAIYLRCPLTIQAYHIRKLLALKYQLEANDRVTLYYKGDIVSDSDQISNLAQSLTFCLHYEISRLCHKTRDIRVNDSIKMIEDN